MKKEDKLKCILIDFEQGEITLSEASNTILRLFSVSGRSEQLHKVKDGECCQQIINETTKLNNL